MAQIPDESVAVLRAMLDGDDEADDLLQAMSMEVARGLALMMASAFAILANRKFRLGCSRAEVADWVRKVRSVEPIEDIDQEIAEEMLCVVLGKTQPSALDSYDEVTKGIAQAFLVLEFVQEARLTDTDIDQLLTTARLQARQVRN